jgi:hypothetical protein
MNNWDISPVLQTNEVARRTPPNSDDSTKTSATSKRNGKHPQHQLLGEDDLQKIRRSSHSINIESDIMDRMEEGDDDGNDMVLDNLRYPCLEATRHLRDVDCDFFEDDYFAAQEAVRLNASIAGSLDNSSQYFHFSDDNNHATHRRTFDAFADLEDDLATYEALHFPSLRRQTDVTSQKLRR